MRYALHADVDLLGRKLSIPVDLNVFSDGTQRAWRKARPSEFDVITGLTSTWDVLIGAVLNMYDSLSARTLALLREMGQRRRMEEKLRLSNNIIESSGLVCS